MWAAAEQSDGPWQFHLRHQSGSLAAAVAQARRRNLGLSFTILVVLTASVVLLVQSTRRARRLAQQQMDFVAGVSHELRTPITVIDSAAHNLAKGVTRNPEQMQKYGRMIQRQTRQLHEMVEQVLEFAGIQSGRNLYELQPVQLNLLLEEFAQANQSWLAERGFQLQLNLAPDLPLVQADAAALRRALQNLLNNAQKYSGESRWIGLQASLDDSRQPAQVMISVSDRGRGIAAQDLPHIFAPFYRSSEVKAAQIHGNGLGLSLVQNIVRAHRGTIRVESNVGTGSTFTIRLPLAELASAQTTAQPAPVLTEVEGQ
jgi:signal transduction histidine kinase